MPELYAPSTILSSVVASTALTLTLGARF